MYLRLEKFKKKNKMQLCCYFEGLRVMGYQCSFRKYKIEKRTKDCFLKLNFSRYR